MVGDILDICACKYQILYNNEDSHTIIVTPENQDSEETIIRWIKFLIENNYPQYLNHIFDLPKEVTDFLRLYEYANAHILYGDVYKNDTRYRSLFCLCPIDIRKDDLESIEITFVYQYSLEYFDEVSK